MRQRGVGGGAKSGRAGLGRTLPLALVVSVSVLLATAPSAFAHAAFVESEPGPGARLVRSPDEIVLQFTEPLNRELTEVELVDPSGEPVEAEAAAGAEREVVVRPGARLDTGAYRVDWHTVSTRDGHALEGVFSFGVRAPAAGGEQLLEESPLARDGWLRVGARALFYWSLFFFAGGVLTAAALGRRADPAGWLVPEPVRPALERIGRDPVERGERLWRRTVDAGWVAVASAVAVALIEAADASGGLSAGGLSAFLLSNIGGLGRVAAVVALLLATLLAARARLGAAAAATGAAFLAVAASGHASSADPSLLAVATDWVHLLAAGVWIGGIAQIAFGWLPIIRVAPGELRLSVMRSVLDRFGAVALPAFAVLVATGLVNALIQLGQPAALWETGYGRVLAVKIALVGLIALASYWHALRLRPRIVAANPHPRERLERRHWRLLASEPLTAVAVVLAAALLVAFPLPPRQLGEAGEADEALAAEPGCDPCPQRKPRPDELAVAEQAGSSIAAVWLRREPGGLRGELRLLDSNANPVEAEATVTGARQEACGPGCWRFSVSGRRAIAVRVPEDGDIYTARLPARWRAEGSARARRLLERAQDEMRSLRTVREHEPITSGPGTLAVTDYRMEAPNRFAYRTKSGGRSVVVGRDQWIRSPGQAWERRPFGAGAPFRARDFFRWTPYARAVRLLDVREEGGRRVAEVALVDELTPLWYRLKIDLRRMLVLRTRMIAGGHFMDERFYAFNEPVTIGPPGEVSDGG